MARPPSWPDNIEAPAPALKFYRMMANMQKTKAFKDCHVFLGATVNGFPIVSWENKTTQLPKVVCSFMGLQYKRKICTTPGCMNPFHYVDQEGYKAIPVEEPGQKAPTPNYSPSLEDYKELVDFHIENNDFTNPTFEQLRSVIPAEDITDELLQKVINEL